MSVSSMTNLAINRRTDYAAAGGVDQRRGKNIEQGKSPPPEAQSAPGAMLASISAYIPTEVITLYVATLGALGSAPSGDKASLSAKSADVAFLAFLVLTPIIVWLIYAGKVASAKKVIPIAFRTWPKWEMSAATISFAAWGAALPNSPLTIVPSAVAAVMIVVVSGLLGLIAPLAQRPLKTD